MPSTLRLRRPYEHSPNAQDVNFRSAKKHERVTIGGKLFATKHRSRSINRDRGCRAESYKRFGRYTEQGGLDEYTVIAYVQLTNCPYDSS